MDSHESSHAGPLAPEPATQVPASAEPHADRFISTKLATTKRADSENTTSPLQWFRDRVYTPTRNTLRRVDVGLFGVRQQLTFDHDPEQDRSALPSRDIDHEGRKPSSPPVANAKESSPPSHEVPSQPPAGVQEANTKAAVLSPCDMPPQNKNDKPKTTGLFLEHGAGGHQHTDVPHLPHIPSETKEIDAIKEKMEVTDKTFSDRIQEMNAGFTAACDRISYDVAVNQSETNTLMHDFYEAMEQSEVRHTAALAKMQEQTNKNFTEAMALMHAENIKTAEGLLGLISEEKPQPRKPPLKENGLLKNGSDRAPNLKAMAALAFSEKFIMSDAESIEAKVLSQFDVETIDPPTFSRHKSRYADVRALAEAIYKDDPSIGADLTSALSKNGSNKITALRNLRDKLGQHSHRSEQLGDMMLLALLTRHGTSATVKTSVQAACRDFIFVGSDEPESFMLRCTEGESILPPETTPAERHALLQSGLQTVMRPEFSATLIVGIILKLGYSNKPTSDLQSLLVAFYRTKQRDKEATFEFINRTEGQYSRLQTATQLLDREDEMPQRGALRKVLKDGVKADILSKATDILLHKYDVTIDQASYTELTASLKKADQHLTANADNDKSQNHSDPPTDVQQKPKNENDKPKKEQQTDQDPRLTLALMHAKVCINHVAYTVGKGKYTCSTKDCNYQHKIPSEVGLKDEAYKQFIAVGAHMQLKKDDILFDGLVAPDLDLYINPGIATPCVLEETEKQTENQQETTDLLAAQISHGVCGATT